MTGAAPAIAPEPSVLEEVGRLLRPSRRPCVVTIGKFDGVHEGHRQVLRRGRECARDRGLALIALTFSPRPEEVLSRGRVAGDLVPLPVRIARLYEAGADDVVVIPFSRRLAAVPALGFVRMLGLDLGMEMLCVGADFALGRGREGTVESLRAAGIEVAAVPVIKRHDGSPMTSTALRGERDADLLAASAWSGA